VSTNGGWFLELGIDTYRLSTQVYTHLPIGFQKIQRPPNTNVYIYIYVCMSNNMFIKLMPLEQKVPKKPFKWKIQCPLMSIVDHMDGHIIRICGRVHFVFH
jgi:hypothetical protein